MCLDISETITEKVRKQLANGRTKFWKALRKPYHQNHLASPFLGCVYRPGWNKKTRRAGGLTREELRSGEVFFGLHLFLSAAGASTEGRAVPVSVEANDFIAAGTFDDCHSAVFTKIYIDPKDYEKALGATGW